MLGCTAGMLMCSMGVPLPMFVKKSWLAFAASRPDDRALAWRKARPFECCSMRSASAQTHQTVGRAPEMARIKTQ
eukprot:12418002-Karenia_brevis.AAC.1